MSGHSDSGTQPEDRSVWRSNIDADSIRISGVDIKDRPDFSDAYFMSARWKVSGDSLTDEELDLLGDRYPELINEMAHESLN